FCNFMTFRSICENRTQTAVTSMMVLTIPCVYGSKEPVRSDQTCQSGPVDVTRHQGVGKDSPIPTRRSVRGIGQIGVAARLVDNAEISVYKTRDEVVTGTWTPCSRRACHLSLSACRRRGCDIGTLVGASPRHSLATARAQCACCAPKTAPSSKAGV